MTTTRRATVGELKQQVADLHLRVGLIRIRLDRDTQKLERAREALRLAQEREEKEKWK